MTIPSDDRPGCARQASGAPFLRCSAVPPLVILRKGQCLPISRTGPWLCSTNIKYQSGIPRNQKNKRRDPESHHPNHRSGPPCRSSMDHSRVPRRRPPTAPGGPDPPSPFQQQRNNTSAESILRRDIKIEHLKTISFPTPPPFHPKRSRVQCTYIHKYTKQLSSPRRLDAGNVHEPPFHPPSHPYPTLPSFHEFVSHPRNPPTIPIFLPRDY
ncbi:hypothetical protein QBC39DRAFT_152472 [Podospora conica]|nr:hypothetical protein QBC39DRAFT_152472 [Schizothecium conicum]